MRSIRTATATATAPLHFLHTGQFGRRNGLSFVGRKVRIVLVGVGAASVAVSASHSSAGGSHPSSRLSLDGTDDHLRRPELKDLWHGKVGNPVDPNVKGFDVGDIPIGRLGDEMHPERTRQTGDTELEVVLKDLIGRPSVLSRFGIVHVLSVAHDLALSAVETPGEDDVVLASTAVGSGFSVRNGGGIGDPKLELDLLFGKAKGLGGVFDSVVNLVGAKDVRHDCCLILLMLC